MNEYNAYNMLRTEDLYLAPLCLILLYFVSYLMKRRYAGSPLAKYIMPAVTIRFVFAILYTLIIAYYYGVGDSFNYYQGVLDMHHAVADDPSVLSEIYSKLTLEKTDRLYTYFYYSDSWAIRYYMLESRNLMVCKFALPFSLLFNKSFLCISFCISYLAFLGCWRILKLFYEIYPHLEKKIAYATLFLPSMLIWGVSLLKDPMCVAAMGFFLYAIHSVFIKRKALTSSIITAIIAGFVMYELKPYILFSLSGIFFLWIFLRLRQRLAVKAVRQIATGFFVLLAGLVGFLAIQGLSRLDENSRYAADNLLNSIQQQQYIFANKNQEGTGSNFDVSSLSLSGPGMAALIPLGVVNTFFRPFPWDIGSPLMAFSGLESMLFLAITYLCFTRVGVGRTFGILFSDPVICFCLLFSLVFGGIIGITTPNFGALVRYKLPCIPFYALGIFLIMDKSGKFSPSYIFSKRLF